MLGDADRLEVGARPVGVEVAVQVVDLVGDQARETVGDHRDDPVPVQGGVFDLQPQRPGYEAAYVEGREPHALAEHVVFADAGHGRQQVVDQVGGVLGVGREVEGRRNLGEEGVALLFEGANLGRPRIDPTAVRQFWHDAVRHQRGVAAGQPGVKTREVQQIVDYLALTHSGRKHLWTSTGHEPGPTVGWDGQVVLLSPEAWACISVAEFATDDHAWRR